MKFNERPETGTVFIGDDFVLPSGIRETSLVILTEPAGPALYERVVVFDQRHQMCPVSTTSNYVNSLEIVFPNELP